MSETRTEELVRDWVKAQEYVERRRDDLARSIQESAETGHLVGERLGPEDMALGEQVGVWVRLDRWTEALVVVTKLDDETYGVMIRRRVRVNG